MTPHNSVPPAISEEEINSLKAELAQAKTLAEEKAALEREYRASKKRFETIFDESSLGKKIIDSDLRIVKVNRALVEILGYGEHELLGVNIIELSHPDFRASWQLLREELWGNHRQSFSIDTCLVKKDNTSLWCHVTSIVFEDQGRTLGYTVIEDISERKYLEQVALELQQKKALLQQEAEVVKAILNTQEKERERIAEGLHNSLGQLLFAAQIELNQIDLRSEQESARLSVRKAEELVHMAIKESRLISHQLMPAILRDFGLKAAIETICNDMSGAVEFSCEIHLLNIQNDKYFEILVYRLVQELMLNIGKHAQATKARVSIDENEREVIITVADNGKGFNIENARGAGIGLYSVRNNVNLLKGDLQFDSSPGKGTIITVRLPQSRLDRIFS